MLQLTHLKPVDIKLTINDTKQLSGRGETDGNVWTATFLAGAAAGGYLWDAAKTNVAGLPSAVSQLARTGYEAAKYAGENSLPRPSGLTLPRY